MNYTETTRAPDYPWHSLPLFLRITAQPPGYNANADKSYEKNKKHSHSGTGNKPIIYIDGKPCGRMSYQEVADFLGIHRDTFSNHMSKGKGRAFIRGHEVWNKTFKGQKDSKQKDEPSQSQEA